MSWNSVYDQKTGGGRWEPKEGMVKLISRFIQRRVGVDQYLVKKQVSLALDCGCGNGNIVSFLERQGVQCIGIDLSDYAIANAKMRPLKDGVSNSSLYATDVEKMDFDEEMFDLIISDGVLDHIPFEKAKRIVSSFYRYLKKEGYLFISLRSIKDSEYGRGENIDKNTYLLENGYEDGELQHFFDIREIAELLNNFKVFDLELHEEIYPSFYSLDKAFLQSSQGQKTYIYDLDHVFDEGFLKSSRYYIAAEKL